MAQEKSLDSPSQTRYNDLMIRNGQFHETRRIDLDHLSLDRAIEVLSEAAEGLTNVNLNIEVGYEYGDTVLYQAVEGWRDATPEEIAHDADQTRRNAAETAARQERDAARLRQERPDLFQ
jgi:hypothetical protein